MKSNKSDELIDFSTRIECAILNNDIELAHKLVDQRLQLLKEICIEGRYSDELVLAAKRALEQDKKIFELIEKQKLHIKIKLRDFMTADKVAQSYKAYSK
ncbi:hypothetical protein [Aeromonas allosaccharophila]|uniref:hypothetical protein n=1 Tax=Aeromonas allosaccharophila TaxID=656 RepID=UPI003437A180